MHPNIKVCSLSKGNIYTTICNEAMSGTYTSYIRGSRCKTESEFFMEVSASLQFPYYFGENWAAFDECLCDLEWIRFEKMLIVIDDYSQMFSNQGYIQLSLQNKVIKYFTLMVDYWKSQKIAVEILLNN